MVFMQNISVVKQEGNVQSKLPTHTVSLSYPQHWFSPVLVNPFSETIEEETVGWMKQAKLITSDFVEQQVRKMEPRHYGGMSAPMANFDHGLLFTKLITYWLLWDDYVVEKAKGESEVLPPIQALMGEEVEVEGDPYVDGLRELGEDFERLGASRGQRMRLAKLMDEWARVALQEENMRQLDRPKLEDVIHMRTVTIGIIPTAVLLERNAGIELPPSVLASSLYERIVEGCSLLCGIQNDVVSVGKDIANKQIKTNIVLLHNQQYSTSLLESYRWVIGLHDRTLRECDALAKKLLDEVEPDWRERVRGWINHLRYAITGYAIWHADARRYKQYVTSEKGVQFAVKVNTQSNSLHAMM